MCAEKDVAKQKIERLIAAMDRLAATIAAATGDPSATRNGEDSDSPTTNESMGSSSI